MNQIRNVENVVVSVSTTECLVRKFDSSVLRLDEK